MKMTKIEKSFWISWDATGGMKLPQNWRFKNGGRKRGKSGTKKPAIFPVAGLLMRG